ncbi:hypothetical protein [Muricoccus aerilatus]|uniref:hypothetical protein n=1 Tax=Muricoccus aerilatus TaxID=452982 RepID=UPI0012EBFE92|nr:hypothetical protein [Roseomonas aerilata]
MAKEPELLRDDPASARAVARVGLIGGFIGAWCTLIHILTARPVTPVPMLVMASFVAAGYAVANRERPLAASLNRWDEAVTFLGLAALAQVVVRSMAT